MLKIYLRILVVSLAVLCYEGLNAQSISGPIDQRIVAMYGQTRLDELLQDQPEYIDYLNFYVKNAFYILENIPEKKLEGSPDISELVFITSGKSVQIEDIENLNILLISLKRNSNEYYTYKIGNTGKAIIFRAPQDMLDDYNTTKRVKARQ